MTSIPWLAPKTSPRTRRVDGRFRSGAIGSFSCSWSARTPFPNETLEIFGPRGAILTEDHGRTLRLKTDAPPPGLADARELHFAVDQAESIRRVIGGFADCVDRGVPPPITGEDGRAALELTMASYRSPATGLPVKLPDRQPEGLRQRSAS